MHYYNAVVLWASCLNKTLDQYPDLRNANNSKPVEHGFVHYLEKNIGGLSVDGYRVINDDVK